MVHNFTYEALATVQPEHALAALLRDYSQNSFP